MSQVWRVSNGLSNYRFSLECPMNVFEDHHIFQHVYVPKYPCFLFSLKKYTTRSIDENIDSRVRYQLHVLDRERSEFARISVD
ncbi:hypothetical protein BC826DRAFT_1048230, partial [Russula brevipes]